MTFPRCANAYCMKLPRWGSAYCSDKCCREENFRQAREKEGWFRQILDEARRAMKAKQGKGA